MWPRDVINCSRWDFWFMKSGCVNNTQRQQQFFFPATHLKPSHCVFNPFSGQSPCLQDDNFHPLEPGRHCWMVVREIQVLEGVIVTKNRCAHFWPFFVVSPCYVWAFWHLPCGESIWGSFLVAGSIVKQKKASRKTIWLCFENVNCVLNLSK